MAVPAATSPISHRPAQPGRQWQGAVASALLGEQHAAGVAVVTEPPVDGGELLVGLGQVALVDGGQPADTLAGWEERGKRVVDKFADADAVWSAVWVSAENADPHVA